ncbi:MAG: molybdopterin cofactor-binding domain-containing protein [Sphingomonadaceae bacterium]
MTAHDIKLSRRAMLQGAGALVIGVMLPIGKAFAQAANPPAPANPNAFIRVAPDNSVTVLIKHVEMGQGPRTGLATVIAEELDADWSQIRAENAPTAPEYINTMVGMQFTGGSTAMAESYTQMRKAGAAARAMLVQAAAQRWKVKPEEITVEKGVIRHAKSRKQGNFGQFAADAAKLQVPADPPLKDPSKFTLIGHDKSVGRPDSPAKVNGTAKFGIDETAPGMLYVVVARPPRFGVKLASFDPAAALKVSGVTAVRQLSSGVAVYARSTWAAMKGRNALVVKWDESGAESRGTDEIIAEYLEKSKKPGLTAKSEGDVDAAIKAAGKDVVEVEYVFPYLAHAPMEPLNGFILWDGKTVDARYGCQTQTPDQAAIAKVLGVKPEQVSLTTTFAGGSFGRRANAYSDFAVELAEAAKAIGPNKPVKLVWTREDDITGGFYRPLIVHRMKGAIKDGKITAWSDSMIGQSFMVGSPFESFVVKSGIDQSMVEGASEIFYDIANFRCDATIVKSPVTTLWWRSVGHTHTGYSTETFIDLLLEKAGKDPVAGRLEMMGKTPSAKRAAAVLKAVAELANWDGPAPAKGRARGVAVVESFGSCVAEIAEVSIGENGEPKVHKMWAAVDCGTAVNPDVIRAQVEGGIGYAMGHILYAEVPLMAGKPTVSNFHDYRSLRIEEMPEVEVTILPLSTPPSGIGEPGVPPCGPAIANALARLGKPRPAHLPMVKPA